MGEYNEKMEKYNEQCNCNTEKIQGIKCEAKSCSYHGIGDKCEAGQIIVQGHTATCPSDTACSTFKQK